MTDTVTDTTKGGYAVGPDGERLGPPVHPDGNMVVALRPDFLVPPESERDVSDAAFTLAEQPRLVAIRYRPVTGDPHVAVGWVTAETDIYYRLDGDLTLRNRDTRVGVSALPSISVNFITKSDIITMLEVTADGAGQLLACWGNPEIVRKRS